MSTFTKGLPHTDEGIAAILHGVANRQCLRFTWDGANTVLTDELIAAFTQHAKAYWFEKPPESFDVPVGERLLTLIAKFRTLEKQPTAA
jgi:hypothetical protein